MPNFHHNLNPIRNVDNTAILKYDTATSEITYTPYSDAYPAGFEDIQRRVPDISKIKSAIGWAPGKDLTQIISDIAGV